MRNPRHFFISICLLSMSLIFAENVRITNGSWLDVISRSAVRIAQRLELLFQSWRKALMVFFWAQVVRRVAGSTRRTKFHRISSCFGVLPNIRCMDADFRIGNCRRTFSNWKSSVHPAGINRNLAFALTAFFTDVVKCCLANCQESSSVWPHRHGFKPVIQSAVHTAFC